jgi:hypothetical protein
MPAKDVKAYVKCGKNDAIDAAACCGPSDDRRSVQCRLRRRSSKHSSCSTACATCSSGSAHKPSTNCARTSPSSASSRHKATKALSCCLPFGAFAVLRRARAHPEKYPWVTQLLRRLVCARKYRSPCGNGSQPLLAAVESSRETMFRALPFCKIRDAHGLHNSSVSLSISVNPRNLPHPAPATPPLQPPHSRGAATHEATY